MPDEKTVDSSPTDAGGESSVPKETPTNDSQVDKPEAVSSDKPLNEHKRFREVIAEKNEYKQQLEDLRSSEPSAGAQGKPAAAQGDSDFSSIETNLYGKFRDRIMGEFQDMANKSDQQAKEDKEKQEQEVQDFTKKFEGDVIPDGFIDFSKEILKKFSATKEQLFEEWNKSKGTGQRVSGKSSTGSSKEGPVRVNRNEDFVTAALNASDKE